MQILKHLQLAKSEEIKFFSNMISQEANWNRQTEEHSYNNAQKRPYCVFSRNEQKTHKS